MNRLIAACVVLVCHAAPVAAHDSTDSTDSTDITDSTDSTDSADYAGQTGDAPRGHGVAVFTGQPALSPQAANRADGFGPASGVGAFTLGRRYDLESLVQPGAGSRFDSLGHLAGRTDGTAQTYVSGGRTVTAAGSWSVATLGGDAVANRAWGLALGVDFGNVSLRAAHQNLHVAQVQLYDRTGATMDAKNSIVALNLRTGWGTAYAAYSMSRGWGNSPLYNPDNPYCAGVASTSSTDSRDVLAGVAVPVSRSLTFLASAIHKNDRDLANRDANQLALGASYVLSRKTDFYAALSHTVITNGAGIPINGASHPSGSSAVNVGMRHAF
jgi:predicted porin